MVAPLKIDPALLDFCTTENQREKVQACIDVGSIRGAARVLGVHHKAMDQALKLVRGRAAMQNVPQQNRVSAEPLPRPYMLRGTSSLYTYDKDTGKERLALQWIKSKADQDQVEQAMVEAAEAMAEDLPRLAPLSPPTHTLASLAALYTVTDYHVGMLAKQTESGADWNLEIAEQTLLRLFEYLITGAPAARVGVLNQLGDFLHSDGLLPITPTHGHVLDQDGRYTGLVKTAIRLLRKIIDMMLHKHERVHVILAEGNHDLASSVWLRHMFAALYENEPRVTIDTSESPYYVFQHGVNMLAFHHGHLKKPEALPLLFAAEFPAIWGTTTYREAHSGHQHHLHIKEYSGMTTVQHRTAAPRDAHSSRGGYHAHREITVRFYSDTTGRVGDLTATPEMFS